MSSKPPCWIAWSRRGILKRRRQFESTRYGASEQYQGLSSYRVHPVSDLAPGVRFFGWLRKMTVDAFYTSPIGIQDVGYQGNQAVSQYEVPESIIQEALRRSPFGGA